MIKVMTYNIRHGWGLERKFGIADIFHTIKSHQPDILGLNEVDVYNPRSLFLHQAKRLAKKLSMNYVFGPNLKFGPIAYGNAILTRYPILEWQNYSLFSRGEPRGCLFAVLKTIQGKINVLCTHLGLDTNERQQQINQILFLIKDKKFPTILMGDFNCQFHELESLKKIFNDVFSFCGKGVGNTFPTIKPIQRLDYILCNDSLQPVECQILNSKASDHLPLVSKIKVVSQLKNKAFKAWVRENV